VLVQTQPSHQSTPVQRCSISKPVRCGQVPPVSHGVGAFGSTFKTLAMPRRLQAPAGVNVPDAFPVGRFWVIAEDPTVLDSTLLSSIAMQLMSGSVIEPSGKRIGRGGSSTTRSWNGTMTAVQAVGLVESSHSKGRMVPWQVCLRNGLDCEPRPSI
jgi:hypothetical protein